MGYKITELQALATTPSLSDLFPIVDVSDTTQSENGSTKKITVGNVAALVGTGDTGIQGDTGVQGDTGIQGDTGDFLAKGDTGDQGDTGVQGDTGAGDTGVQGATGATGGTGVKGDTGSQGTQGVKGDTGSQGATGATGATGVQGDTGTFLAKGDTGIQGDTGDQGDTGTQGNKGDTGTAGAGVNWLGDWSNLVTYSENDAVQYQGTSYISNTGSNLNNTPGTDPEWDTWVEKGDTGTTGSQGDTGVKGDTGSQGTQGLTGDQGDTGIQGDTGAQGATGVTGATGVGDTGVKGDTGNQGATGVTGATGAQGDTGISTDMTVTASPGSDHTATGIKITLTADENLVFGDVGYIKSNGNVGKADADAIATSSALVMALGTINSAASGTFLLLGLVRDDSWAWTVGGLVYLSVTAGTLTQTAPSATDDVVQIVGVATHADRMFFYPQLVQVEIV